MHKHPRIAPRRAVHDTHDMMLNTEQALEKLIQYATVEQLDCTGALVRVRAGDNLTDWVRLHDRYDSDDRVAPTGRSEPAGCCHEQRR